MPQNVTPGSHRAGSLALHMSSGRPFTRWRCSAAGNKFFQDNKPWTLLASDLPQCKTLLAACLGLVVVLGALVEPYMPSVTVKVSTCDVVQLPGLSALISTPAIRATMPACSRQALALPAGVCSLQRLSLFGLRHVWCCLRADCWMQVEGSVLIFWYAWVLPAKILTLACGGYSRLVLPPTHVSNSQLRPIGLCS